MRVNSGGTGSSVYATAPQSPAISSVRRKLQEFGALRPGWHFGQGVPVSVNSITVAERFLSLAETLALRSDVFPGTEGECMVAMYQGDFCVRIVVDPDVDDAHYALRVERGKGLNVAISEENEHASLNDVCREAVKLVRSEPSASYHLWHLPEHFTSSTTTPNNKLFWISSSRTTPLKTEAGGHQSSMTTVRAKR